MLPIDAARHLRDLYLGRGIPCPDRILKSAAEAAQLKLPETA